MIDHGLRRVFSLGLILVLATGLTLAKAVTVAVDLSGGGPSKDTHFTGQDLDQASKILGPGIINEDDFIPWPSSLPEPAAGPEQGDEPSTAGDDQLRPEFDPSRFSEGEIMALKQLSARRRELDEREEMLDIRAALNEQTEMRLDQQIEKLSQLKTQLEALVKGLDESEELKLARLVKIYETMKPKAAAEIFNRLEISILLHVVERMKEAKSAAVLSKMDPVVAKQVTTELARKKQRPTLADSGNRDEV